MAKTPVVNNMTLANGRTERGNGIRYDIVKWRHVLDFEHAKAIKKYGRCNCLAHAVLDSWEREHSKIDIPTDTEMARRMTDVKAK